LRGRERAADALDFPLEPNPGGVVDAAPDLFAEALEIGRCGNAGVDQKIRVLL
jgi:hypothetical protein